MSHAAQRTLEPESPDAWIVDIAAQRNRESFVALFTAYAPKVKSYLVSRGLADAVAEEISQDTLLIVWRKAGQFDPARASAGAWIFTIARNLRVDYLRRESGARPAHRDEQPEAQPTPEDQVKSMQMEALLGGAIDALPPEQAQIVRLSYFEEWTHPEIATNLGLPLGTVKSRMRLATTHLRAILDRSV